MATRLQLGNPPHIHVWPLPDMLIFPARALAFAVGSATATGFLLSHGTIFASQPLRLQARPRADDQIIALPSGAASAAPMIATATPVHVIHSARCSGLTTMGGTVPRDRYGSPLARPASRIPLMSELAVTIR